MSFVPETFDIDPRLPLLDQRVPRAGPYKWPLPVLVRLRAIVIEANELGVKTNQAEVLAAMVCGPPLSSRQLKSRVETYRVATVGAATRAQSEDPTISLEARNAGRPRGT
jgi:hypothetical protein